MTNQEKLKILMDENIKLLMKASDQLTISLERCQPIDLHKDNLTIEEQEKLEALTGRFARLSDRILQKSLRLIEQIELEDMGSILDRIYKAEKKGLIDSAEEFIEIRQLRNSIAHDYDVNTLKRIFSSCIKYSPALIVSVQMIIDYAKNTNFSK